MKSFYSFVLLLIGFPIFSQGLLQKQADTYYNQLAYAEAVEYYKDLSKGKAPLENNIRRAAESYFNLLDYPNAILYYKKLEGSYSAGLTSLDLLNYAQALKYTGEYKQAASILSKLNTKQGGTSLVYKNHKNFPDYDKKLKEDSALYHIINVDGINTESSEFAPVLFKNKSYMMYASNRRNTSARNKIFAWDNSYFIDMYTSSKTDSTHFKSGVELPKAVESLYHDGPVELSADENTMYLTRTNYINKKVGKDDKRIVNLKLFILKRDSTGALGKPESFPYNSDNYSIGHAAITPDGQRLYFVSDMPGGFGQTDLWFSELKDNVWQKPENMGQAVNTEGREMFPFVNEDGYLFFSSDGRAGLGGLDVFYTAPQLDAAFEPQGLAYPINTQSDDFGFYLNEDLKTGYLSSNRAGGKGKDDIYFFSSKVPLLGVSLQGIVYDENTKKIVPGARVFLMDKNDKILDSLIADTKAMYSFRIPDPSKTYKLGVKERSLYYDRVVAVNDLNPGDNAQDVYLFPKYTLICEVTDEKTRLPIEGVKATLIPKFKGDKVVYYSDSKGTFTDVIRHKKAGDKLEVAVKFEKTGYITTIQDYVVTLDKDLVINLNDKLNGRLQKIEKGIDIAKTLKLNPIYFDLGKWNIRPDGAKELDKIVKVMQENPSLVIELGSHTDCRSSASYNMKLSDKRAKSSAEYVIANGIDKSRIYGKGYGESKLINDCACEGGKVVPCSEEQHQANRRTEFIIVKF